MSTACSASRTEEYTGKIERAIEYDDGHFAVIVRDDTHKLYKAELVDDDSMMSDVRTLLTGGHHVVRHNGFVTVETTTTLRWHE